MTGLGPRVVESDYHKPRSDPGTGGDDPPRRSGNDAQNRDRVGKNQIPNPFHINLSCRCAVNSKLPIEIVIVAKTR